MNPPLAALPMYDWPEIRTQTTDLWRLLATACQDHGLAPPAELTRSADTWSIWRSPDLFLAQTCGLPFDLHLRRMAQIVGTPAYACADDPPGSYHSVIIARPDTPRDGLLPQRVKTLAVNALHSQSGYAALLEQVAPADSVSQHLGQPLVTGTHRQSVRAVASGAADIAAIDCISWHLSRQFEPTAQQVAVISRTAARPALPFITAIGNDADGIADAVEDCFASLPAAITSVLGLTGFRRLTERDYGDFAHRFSTALSAHGLPQEPALEARG